MTQFDVTNKTDLDRLVEQHQGLLSGDVIISVVAAIPAEFADDPRTKLLQAVVLYHKQHKTNPPQWIVAYDAFWRILPAYEYPLVEFYIHNYCFLAGRNAGFSPLLLNDLFGKAEIATQRIDEPRKSQLLGFLYYNYARYLLKIQEKDRALTPWQAAATARLRWYCHLRDEGTDEVAIKAAATQVWKMRQDFNADGFFPSLDIDASGVSAEIFAEVASLADPNFSAKP